MRLPSTSASYELLLHHIIPSSTKFYHVLPSSITLYHVHQVLPCSTKFYQVLPHSTKFYHVLPCSPSSTKFTKFYTKLMLSCVHFPSRISLTEVRNRNGTESGLHSPQFSPLKHGEGLRVRQFTYKTACMHKGLTRIFWRLPC